MNYEPDAKKTLIGRGVLAASFIGLILGMIFRKPFLHTFTIGTWITFAAFLLSLAAVQDHGSNKLARLAYWTSFLCMFATVFFGALV